MSAHVKRCLSRTASPPAPAHESRRQQLASDLIVEALQRTHGHSLDALARGLCQLQVVLYKYYERELLARSQKSSNHCCSASRTPTAGAAPMHGERRLLQTAAMLSVLSLMQSEVPPSVLETMERNEASLSVLLKRDLLESARRIGLSPDSSSARKLVSRLVVPYVKVALLDRQMFMYRTHRHLRDPRVRQPPRRVRDTQGGAFEDALQRMVGRLKQDIA